MITSRLGSLRHDTLPQLWPFKERPQVIFNELPVLSTSPYLICITTITLQNIPSKINDTAALFVPAAPHSAPQHHPPRLASILPPLSLLSFSSTLHRSCSSFSGDPCHKWLHHFPCTIGADKPIKHPKLWCVVESVCIKLFHDCLLVWSLSVRVDFCVCMRVSGWWPCILNVSIPWQSLAAELWSHMPSYSTWGRA